jgi:hypothetical protein
MRMLMPVVVASIVVFEVFVQVPAAPAYGTADDRAFTACQQTSH